MSTIYSPLCLSLCICSAFILRMIHNARGAYRHNHATAARHPRNRESLFPCQCKAILSKLSWLHDLPPKKHQRCPEHEERYIGLSRNQYQEWTVAPPRIFIIGQSKIQLATDHPTGKFFNRHCSLYRHPKTIGLSSANLHGYVNIKP